MIDFSSTSSLSPETPKPDKIILQKSRVVYPFVWIRNGRGVKIQDLTKEYYDLVIEMFKFFYIQEEVLCRNTIMEVDLTSVKCLTKGIRRDMEQSISLVAIDEVEDKLAGALILTLKNEPKLTSQSIKDSPIEGRALSICINLTNHLYNKCNIYQHFNCDKYVNYSHLCIKPEYRSKGIGYLLMRGGIQIARTLNSPVIMSILSSNRAQTIAKDIGMQVIEEMPFKNWRDEKDKMWFASPGARNVSCALMGCRIPDDLPKEPPPPPVPQGKSPVSSAAKKKK